MVAAAESMIVMQPGQPRRSLRSQIAATPLFPRYPAPISNPICASCIKVDGLS
jgi:hypothetical protein